MFTTSLSPRCLASLLVLLAVTPLMHAVAQQPVVQQPGARATPQGVLIDFQEIEIRNVVTALAEAAGLNVTFGDLPSRRITLRVRQPVPVDSVRGLLRSVAEANGLRVIDSGGLLRIDTVAPRLEGTSSTAPPQAGAPQLYVYRLRHARAGRIAGTLQAIFGGGSTTELSETGAVSLSQRLRDQQIPLLRLDTMSRGRVAIAPAAPAPNMQSSVQIVPDENTNSVLVRASPAEWQAVEQAIEAMDLRPLQVLIEVLIAEVRRSSELNVGVSGKTTQRAPNGETRGAGELGGSATDPSTGELLLKWMNGGSVDVNVALRALASRGDVRILSRPVLLAQNNQEARILVGSQRPFVQVFRSLPTETGVRDQIVQYRDVGTALTIVPTVNPDGYVNLQLTQEVSNATNETQFGAPVISTREAQTYLFVRDGQTTVIGGLIDRQGERSRSGIPVLVSIPVLGALFGTTHNTSVHSELFLFLTPHVVRSDDELDDLRDRIGDELELLPKELRHLRPDDARSRARSPDGGPAPQGSAPRSAPRDTSVRRPELRP